MAVIRISCGRKYRSLEYFKKGSEFIISFKEIIAKEDRINTI